MSSFSFEIAKSEKKQGCIGCKKKIEKGDLMLGSSSKTIVEGVINPPTQWHLEDTN
jgi:hypothetical protein